MSLCFLYNLEKTDPVQNNIRQLTMSTNFLQRFKGKTTTIGKQGVQNILGSKNSSNTQTHTSFKRELHAGINKTKSSLGYLNDQQSIENKYGSVKSGLQTASKDTFLASKFQMEEDEERGRNEGPRNRKVDQQQEETKAYEQGHQKRDPKQGTKTSNYSKSVDKKGPSNKEWTKLGGLGANIGGDQWLQKKKKLQKMQQFACQVKSINADRIKPMRQQPLKKETKQMILKQKALEYSKNVPKPVPRHPHAEYLEYPEQQLVNEDQEIGLQEQITSKSKGRK